jgi:hypothetical protein
MADLWDFLIAAVVVWGIVKAIAMMKGVKFPVRERRKSKEEDREGLLIGGITLLLIGIALNVGFLATMGNGPWYIGGFVCVGIGIAMLISYALLCCKSGRKK